MPCNSFRVGQDYVRKYNSRNFKANRKQAVAEGGVGNFYTTRTGDLKPWTYVTKHAQERMAQRGVSHSDAIKGKATSGAIIAPNGAVVTVVPNTWVDQRKKARAHSRSLHSGRDQRKPPSRINAREQHTLQIPEASSLPGGHSLKKLKVNYLGFVLGSRHSNIKKLILRKYPGIHYSVVQQDFWIWGEKKKASSLSNDLHALDREAIDAYGPPIPREDTLPNGEVMKRIVVPKNTIPHIFGAHKQKLKKMREEAGSAVSISAGEIKRNVLCIWGRADAVEKTYNRINNAIKDAKVIERQKAEKRRIVAKESQKNKMAQYKKDMEAFRRAGGRGNKKGNKNSKAPKAADGGTVTRTKGASSTNRAAASSSTRNDVPKPKKKQKRLEPAGKKKKKGKADSQSKANAPKNSGKDSSAAASNATSGSVTTSGEIVSLKGEPVDGKHEVVIVSGFFSPEINIRDHASRGVKIVGEDNAIGKIEGPFGKAGKCKVSFEGGLPVDGIIGKKVELL